MGVELLLGDPTEARERLGRRHEIAVRDLAREMVEADIQALRPGGQ